MTVNRHLAAALAVALLVSVPALGCGSDDGDNGTTEAATGADTGTRTLGEGIEKLQEAQTQVCPELADLEANLTEVSTSGTEAGQDVLQGLGDAGAAIEARVAALNAAGLDDAATAAEDLASRLKSLSTSSGEDARALAGEAADGAQQLTDALQCP